MSEEWQKIICIGFFCGTILMSITWMKGCLREDLLIRKKTKLAEIDLEIAKMAERKRLHESCTENPEHFRCILAEKERLAIYKESELSIELAQAKSKLFRLRKELTADK